MKKMHLKKWYNLLFPSFRGMGYGSGSFVPNQKVSIKGINKPLIVSNLQFKNAGVLHISPVLLTRSTLGGSRRVNYNPKLTFSEMSFPGNELVVDLIDKPCVLVLKLMFILLKNVMYKGIKILINSLVVSRCKETNNK